MNRTIIDYLLIALKGFGMGSADVVPGVSGGTIAFITGIYEELINSIKSIDLGALKVLRKEGIGAAWKHINGWFLVAVFGGILVSVFSLAKVLKYLLEHEPVLLWSFFLGLILASAVFVGRQIRKWNAVVMVFLVIGTGLALFIALSSTFSTPNELWFVFIVAAIAICAMILPGISGSFILVIMGQYGYILDAVDARDFKTVLVFIAGAAVGLLSFARLVSFLFKSYRDATIALLTGFMIGSIPKVWPWKIATPEELKRGLGELVLPDKFSETMGDPQVLYAVLLVVAGFAIVFLMERFGVSSKEANKA